MNRDQILQLLEGIDDRYVTECARFDPAQHPTERSGNMKSKRMITFALAAALLLGLGTVAYAAGWIGPKAITIEGSTSYAVEKQEDGSLVWTENPEGGRVSLTQPQETPEELDPAIREKLKISQTAWAEWTEYRSTRPLPKPPAVFEQPEGAFWSEELPQEDGTVTLRFYSREPQIGPDGQPVYDPEALVEERTATPEDYAALEQYGKEMDAYMLYESKYDFNYHCYSAEDEAKLEEIAAKYGLRLRGAGTILWSGETCRTTEAWWNAAHGTDTHTDFSGPRFLTNAELAARVAAECCHGDFFYETPLGFDKFYYFDEGGFGLSWYVIYTPERQETCYVYNAPYGTLSSGQEVTDMVGDLSALTERSHTAPDGTVLTVLQSPERAFFYVYLADSYLCGDIHGGLSESEVDAVLDGVQWSSIGKG